MHVLILNIFCADWTKQENRIGLVVWNKEHDRFHRTSDTAFKSHIEQGHVITYYTRCYCVAYD